MLASFTFPFFCFFVFCFVFPVLGFCFCCVAFGFIPGAFTPEPAPELKERPPGGIPVGLPKPLPVPIPPLRDTRDPPRPIPGPLGLGVPLPGGRPGCFALLFPPMTIDTDDEILLKDSCIEVFRARAVCSAALLCLVEQNRAMSLYIVPKGLSHSTGVIESYSLVCNLFLRAHWSIARSPPHFSVLCLKMTLDIIVKNRHNCFLCLNIFIKKN